MPCIQCIYAMLIYFNNKKVYNGDCHVIENGIVY